MMNTRRSITQLLGLAVGLVAPIHVFADIPPAPQPPQPIPQPTAPAPSGPTEYQLLLDDDLSAVILGSTNFQSTTRITIQNNTGFCSTNEKSWKEGQRALTCRETTSCVATVPACVMTFPAAQAGLGPYDFVTVLSQQAATVGINGPNS